MLVYDISNEKSFENIKNWIRNIEEVRLVGAALLKTTCDRKLLLDSFQFVSFLTARLV